MKFMNYTKIPLNKNPLFNNSGQSRIMDSSKKTSLNNGTKLFCSIHDIKNLRVNSTHVGLGHTNSTQYVIMVPSNYAPLIIVQIIYWKIEND